MTQDVSYHLTFVRIVKNYRILDLTYSLDSRITGYMNRGYSKFHCHFF